MHFARYCPHSTKNIGKPVTVFESGDVDNMEKAVLFTGGKVDALNILAAESMNAAVLDSACSSTVAGENWINCYLDTLS